MNDARMELPPDIQRPTIRSCLKDEGVREAIRRDRVPPHLVVGEEGAVRVIGFGEPADEGVVHEGVRGGDARKEAASVVQGVGEGGGGEEEELPGDEGVGVEAGLGGMGMDLFEVAKGLAVSQQGDALQVMADAHVPTFLTYD